MFNILAYKLIIYNNDKYKKIIELGFLNPFIFYI